MSDAVLIAIIITGGTVVTATISAVGVVLAQRTLSQAKSTHQLMNSRMTELLDTTRDLARSEGKEAGELAARRSG